MAAISRSSGARRHYSTVERPLRRDREERTERASKRGREPSPPPPENKRLRAEDLTRVIERIQRPQRMLTAQSSIELNQKIKRERSLVDALLLVERYLENRQGQIELTINHYNYNSILSFKDPSKQAWELKKQVFAHLPREAYTAHNFNAYLQAAGEWEFSEAKKTFEMALRERKFDTLTLNCYIQYAGKSEEFAEAKKAFDLAMERHIADEITYLNYMIAAHKNLQFAEAISAYNQFHQHFDNCALGAYVMAVGEKRFAEAKIGFDYAARTGKTNPMLFANYMEAAADKNNQRLDEVQRAFDIAVNTGKADTAVYNIYIKTFGANQQFAKADRVFTLAERAGKADVITYNTFIKAAGDNNQFAAAKEAYRTVIRKQIADEVTYATYIQIAGENKQFSEAAKAYDKAIEEGKYNAITLRNYMHAAIANQELGEAKRPLDRALREGLADNKFFNEYIQFAWQKHASAEAIRTFGLAQAAGKVDNYTCAAQITGAWKHKRSAEAIKVFDFAVRENMVDEAVYTSHIMGAGENRQFAEAKRAFDLAVKELGLEGEAEEGQVAEGVVHSYNHAAWENEQPAEAIRVFNMGNLPIEDICSHIQDAGNHGHFEEAKRVYEVVLSKGVIETRFLTIYIIAAAKNQQFGEAKKTFELAVEKKQYDAFMLSVYIKAAWEAKQADEAIKALEITIKEKPDVYCFNVFLFGAGENGKLAEAAWAFNQALKVGGFEQMTFSVYITVLYSHGYVKEAREIYELGIKKGFFCEFKVKQDRGIPHLDLHTFSHGAGILHVDRYINTHRELSHFGVICGKAEGDVNEGVFREALLQHFITHYPNFTCIVDERNIGSIEIQKRR